MHSYVTGVGGRSRKRNPHEAGFLHTAVLTCACGATEEINLKTLMPEEVLDKKFKRKGWRLDPATCPACQRPAAPVRERTTPTTAIADAMKEAEKKAAKTMKKQSQVVEKKAEDAKSEAASAPTIKAIRAQVTLIRLLEEHFDAERGCYLNGYGDRKIAEETGLALSVVQAFRNEGYGPLKIPREIKDLQDEIELLSMQLEDLTRKVGDDLVRLRQRVTALAASHLG